MNLVNMHRVKLARVVEDSPMLVAPDPGASHRRHVGGIFLIVDVETVSILGEHGDEPWRLALQALEVDDLEEGRSCRGAGR